MVNTKLRLIIFFAAKDGEAVSDQIRSVAQSCLTLCNPVDGSPLDSSVPGILQARILHTSHQCQLPGLDQSVQFSSVAQSCPTLCDPMNHSTQASLSITNSRSSLKLTSIESLMPSSHLILCRPLLLLPPIPPSIRVFSIESTLLIEVAKVLEFQL